MRTALMFILALLLMNACAPAVGEDTAQAVATPEPGPQLVGPVWELVTITLATGATLLPGEGDYTLRFTEDGRMDAGLDCNSGGSTYESTAEGSISIGPVVSTLMFCGDDSIAADFTGALQAATAYNFTGGDLFITTPDGTVLHLAERAG